MGRLIQKDDEAQLATCHPDLVRLMKEVVKRVPFDCIVIYGHRSVAVQQQLFAIGRTRPGRIVTNLDGVNKRSRHNFTPSLAVDIAPHSVVSSGVWKDTARSRAEFNQLGQTAEAVAKELGITDYRWGGRFTRPVDMPHHELTRKA
jgi:hypothetical protein